MTKQNHDVDSSNIASIGYDDETRKLEVRFHAGTVYEYDAVPADVVARLLAAESVGRAFHQLVKGVYDYRKIA